MKFTAPKLGAFVSLAQEHLSGYTAEEAERKHAFHRDGKAILVELAKRAELTQVKIHSNKAGPAIGGEVYLVSAELFVELPNACQYGILYRRGKDGPNRWEPWASLLDLPTFAAKLRAVATEGLEAVDQHGDCDTSKLHGRLAEATRAEAARLHGGRQ
jgi:hypothetical protein